MSTLYPNILAEYRASGFNLSFLAKHADVTDELMKSVLENNEKLNFDEMRGLCGLFSSGRHDMFSYLTSPKQSMMNPDKNKTRYRVKLLKDAVSEVQKLVSAGVYIGPVKTRQLKRAYLIIDALNTSSQPVGYAFYWWTMQWMQITIDCHKPAKRRGLW
jgi:hypothetical protein